MKNKYETMTIEEIKEHVRFARVQMFGIGCLAMSAVLVAVLCFGSWGCS